MHWKFRILEASGLKTVTTGKVWNDVTEAIALNNQVVNFTAELECPIEDPIQGDADDRAYSTSDELKTLNVATGSLGTSRTTNTGAKRFNSVSSVRATLGKSGFTLANHDP